MKSHLARVLANDNLLRDRDQIFGQDFVKQVKAMGIKQVLSAPRSPWQRAYVERVIGTIRRECLDHLIVFTERSLYRHLRTFVDYYHWTRVHLALQKDTPETPADPATGVWPDRLDTSAGRPASSIRAARRLSNPTTDVYPSKCRSYHEPLVVDRIKSECTLDNA